MLKASSFLKLSFSYGNILYGAQILSSLCFPVIAVLGLQLVDPVLFATFLRFVFSSQIAGYLEAVFLKTEVTSIGILRAILEESYTTHPMVQSLADACLDLKEQAALNAEAAEIARVHTQVQVDISIHPQNQAFMDFADERERCGNAGKPLPQSFPEEHETKFTNMAYIAAGVGTSLILIISYFFK